jgi:glycosyltransferase involved in cell wall biosynthesis
MNKIIFSVIVANYNNGKYLLPLIESVQKQTFLHWELVIADDCSTDHSMEVLAPYMAHSGVPPSGVPPSQIKVIRHEQNRGAATTFRTAMENSVGEFVALLGADDALTVDALQIMYEAHIQCPKASMVYSRYYDCDEALNVVDIGSLTKPIKEGKSIIHQICVANLATLKRKFYNQTEGLNPYFKRALDQDLFLKLEEVGEVVFVDKPLYYYRRHSAGISQEGNSEKARMFHIMAMYDAYKRRKKSDFINLSQDEMHYYLRYYYLYQAENNVNEGIFKRLSYLFKNLLYIPKDVKRRDFWQVFAKIIGLKSNDKPIILRGNIIP